MTLYQQYEKLYDEICDFLDSEFSKHNHCDFVDGSCHVNRNQLSKSRMFGKNTKNGCCTSFTYGVGLSIKNARPCKHLGERGCTTKNTACKVHVCDYIISHGAPREFCIKHFPITKKERDVLLSNPLKTREEIIEKLVKTKKSWLPYPLFWLLNRAVIKS